MRLTTLWPCMLAAMLAGAAPKDEPAKDLVVHEWGTFLSMAGSDGVVLDGMYHEEHALPPFVHARSREQLRLPSAFLKGETPVIYFYTGQRQKVRVDVKFPTGLWTQWYPQAQLGGPLNPAPGRTIPLRDGFIVWCPEIVPVAAGKPVPAPPATSTDALWNYARDVDAAYVQTNDWTKGPKAIESERFLFYRGLGKAPLPVVMQASSGGSLSMDKAGKHGVSHVFVLRVEGGKGTYSYRPALRPGERATEVIPSMANARPIEEFSARLADDLAARLVESGLYAKEARAMVNTWRTSYFQTEGVRTLFVLPQAWTDGFIPLTITPKPKEMVRVMVGRIELLTPARERVAEAAVRDLSSPDAPTRLRAFNTLQAQGRYVEPILRRVLATSKDEEVLSLCRRLLMTEFVTSLRSESHAAADGKQLAADPSRSEALLSILLKDVGLADQAKGNVGKILAQPSGAR
jgi:hypothetical protein